jgi:hypothetical protein
MKTDMNCVVQSKYDLNWVLKQLREVWTKNFKTSPAEEDDVEMTGDGEDLGEPSPDEDEFEKQMCLSNKSDKTAVRVSPSQAQVDQLEGWLLEKPISYISNDNFSQEGIFDYWNGKLSGHAHVKRTYPGVVRMWRQFHGCPGSGVGIERVFTAAGKQHDDLKKNTMDETLEIALKAGMNTKLPVGRRLVGDRVKRRWLSYGVSQWLESGLFDL